MSEHINAPENDEDGNIVGRGLGYLDDAHLIADVAHEGSIAGSGFGGLADAMAHHLTETWAGEGTALDGAMMGINGVMSPIAMVGGIMEMIEGYGELDRDAAAGSCAMMSGGAGILSGASGLAAVGGASAAGPVAPLAAAFGAGVKGGHYGDANVKKLGWLHDDDGSSLSASEALGAEMHDADAWVTKHTGVGALGTGAALLTGLATLPAAGTIAVAGAGAGAVHGLENAGTALGAGLANHHRAAEYRSMDGFSSDEAAQDAANYDDGLNDAVERSKREHPERWGGQPLGPTPAWMEAVKRISTGKKDAS